MKTFVEMIFSEKHCVKGVRIYSVDTKGYLHSVGTIWGGPTFEITPSGIWKITLRGLFSDLTVSLIYADAIIKM